MGVITDRELASFHILGHSPHGITKQAKYEHSTICFTRFLPAVTKSLELGLEYNKPFVVIPED